MKRFNARTRLPVRSPFRLDFTVDALRRLAANVVDVVGTDGTLFRALRDDRGTSLVAIRYGDERSVDVRATGRDAERWWPLVARMLGTQVDVSQWYVRSARVPWLAPLATAFRGVKPPRYASAWEACAHAIVFAQISIHAAAAIMRRAVEALGEPVLLDEGMRCFAFPEPERWLAADEAALRAAGLSRNKVAHLRSVATAFVDGVLNEQALSALPTPDAAAALCAVRGIGPWGAAVVLLRGLGRLDVFPMRDSGVARSLALLAGGPVDLEEVLGVLGPVRGMLYYHLLLGRLHR